MHTTAAGRRGARAAPAGAPRRGVATAAAPQRVLVLGGGAMGSLFAARLSAAASAPRPEVVMLTAWEEQARALCGEPLVVEAAPGLEVGEARAHVRVALLDEASGHVAHLAPAAGADQQPLALEEGSFDLALVLVKVSQTERAVRRFARRVPRMCARCEHGARVRCGRELARARLSELAPRGALCGQAGLAQRFLRSDGGVALTLQNGVGGAEVLSRVLEPSGVTVRL